MTTPADSGTTGSRAGSAHRLTREQEAIWINDALAEDRSCYTVLWAHRLRGEVDPDAAEGALDDVIHRHESLRSRFLMEDGNPVQRVEERSCRPLVRADCPESELAERLAALAAEPLDPAGGPLRPTLLRLSDDDWVLAVLIHHLVVDDWSLSLLNREFGRHYRTRARPDTTPAPSATPPPPPQLGPHADTRRATPLDEGDLRHWAARLANAPEICTVPPDRPRPAERGTDGARIAFRLDEQLTDAVSRLARATRTTPFTIFTAAVTALLHRHGAGDDIVVGTPVSRRGNADLDSIVGCLSDLMPLRTHVDGEASFRDLVRSVRSEALGMLRHRDVPFGELVRRTVTAEQLNRFPLFQVVVQVNDAPEPGLELPGVTAERLHVHPGTAKFDLCFDLAAEQGSYRGFLDYATDLYDPATARRIADRFRTLLAAAVTDPDLPIAETPLLTGEETALVTRTWARASDPADPPPPVHVAFEAQRRRTPAAPAAVWHDRQLTYEELGAAADRLAHRLIRGGATGRPVGILMDRSLDMTVAVLAVLKSGSPYVPLDPAYPAERLAYMIEDSGLHTLLTQPSLRDRCALPPSVHVLQPDRWAEEDTPTAAGRSLPETGPDDLAYLMYTSGSTGQPKGVAMPHGPVAGLVRWQCHDSAAGPGDRTLQFSALSFDASFLEFFSTWSTGGTLVLIDAEQRTDYDALLEVIEKQRVMRIFLPFVALQSIAFYATAMDLPAPALRECVTAGEQLHVTPAIRAFFGRLDDAVLFNQYGPTETHSVSSLRLDGDPADWPLMPTIGHPINGAEVYVLDGRLRPQPAGVVGELCVAGPPVSQGYWGRDDLTAQKFVPHPLDGAGSLYRTGDMARYLPNGQIEFLGRRDGMVKIRGYRVELGEVEAAIRSVEGIADVVVTARSSEVGDTRLVAHYRPGTDPAPSAATLRKQLADLLPEYMLPSAYRPTDDEFPRTPSGKVDRLALAALR
ncbi:amino acid adenylation domain-containing protein [Streptomyces sp. Isolate_45]|uniref:non-ribosomal peptide synthetase n=1 Tax=Streptomyces sp. Isolate_45 TaxID=2950111 RepID=UPI00248204C0|nr:amino acid adenylation domain-containing protein [Streptomyces sp. Isolate_45]MDA5285550.1 amino acid adenylation domain-containing protein [Streptomyces sp. Isolate_45]